MTTQNFYFWIAAMSLSCAINSKENEYWINNYYDWYLANEEVDG